MISQVSDYQPLATNKIRSIISQLSMNEKSVMLKALLGDKKPAKNKHGDGSLIVRYIPRYKKSDGTLGPKKPYVYYDITKNGEKKSIYLGTLEDVKEVGLEKILTEKLGKNNLPSNIKTPKELLPEQAKQYELAF